MQPILHETTVANGVAMQWIPLLWGAAVVRIAWGRLFGVKSAPHDDTVSETDKAARRADAQIWTAAATLYVEPGIHGRGSTWR